MKGSRVQAVVQEMQGEKIDIIPWSPDIATFVVNALQPASVSRVVIDEEEERIEVVVPDDQLSLAIGRRGQNVRLASQLTGKAIDILTEQDASEKRQKEFTERTETFQTSFDVPTFAVAGKPLRVPFTVESSLPRDEPATLEMHSSTGEVVTKNVVIPAMSRLQDALVWRPEQPGEVRLKLTVPRTGGEHFLDNNSLEAPLSIRKEQLKVLVVESYPRWEFRYLRNALERDPGVAVNCVLFQPDLGKPGAGKDYLPAFPKDEDLTKYDVVFLGDVGVVPGQLTNEQCAALAKLVRDQAGGLVFLPGLRGYEESFAGTALADLLPVVLDEAQPRGFGTTTPGNFTLTEAGTHSLLTKLEDSDDASARVWSSLPGFQWYAPALRARAGAEVLATHSTEANRFGRVPLIVTKTYGSGKILFMGTDGAWRWRRGVEDRYHYRFWGQVVRWMAYQRNMSSGDKMRAVLLARPAVGRGGADAQRQRHQPDRRAAARGDGHRADHRALGQDRQRAAESGGRGGVGAVHGRVHAHGAGRSPRPPELRRRGQRVGHDDQRPGHEP